MSRNLFGASVSTAALLLIANVASAQVYGGGSSLVAVDLGNNGTAVVPNSSTDELGTYNESFPHNQLFSYDKSSSGDGRNAFLQNNDACNTAGIAFPTTCGTNPGFTVAYGNTDAGFSTAELNYANTKPGSGGNIINATYGDLISIPFLGTGVAIPVVNSKVTANGAVILQDSDLCGIFSGKITNWNKTTASSSLTAGPITVVYRADSSGTTNLFTTHLATVCTTGTNGNSNITFTATSTFASLFPNSTPPSNFIGETGSGAVQTELLSLTSATGYISPDYTNIVNTSVKLYDAALGTAGNTPTYTNVASGLDNPVGTFTAPTSANAANPTLWIPIVPTVSKGYTIVGFTNIGFAQCYSTANAAVESSLSSFLSLHYTNASYKSIQEKQGFVPLSTLSTPFSKYYSALQSLILSSSAATGLQSTTGCKGFSGR